MSRDITSMRCSGTLQVTIPIEVLHASRGKLTVRMDGDKQIVYAGGILYATADITVTPGDKS